MNKLKITLDGRVTAWVCKLHTPKASKLQLSGRSSELELFSALPEPAKVKFLESTMGSSHVSNSQNVSAVTKKARRGSKGITSYGRSQVRCGAQWLEDTYGIKNLSFLTCTLPKEALADYTPQTWAEVVKRFRDKLHYHLRRYGLEPLVVAVTEIQMKRWEAEQGQVPVHLHLIFHGRTRAGSWAFRPHELQVLWSETCQSVWASNSEWSASIRVESLRSSSVNYLGKYMSKGVSALHSLSPESLPTGWYSISTKLKALIKKLEVHLSGELATQTYQWLKDSELIWWQREVITYNPDTGYLYLVAWMAALKSREIYHELLDDILPIRNILRGGILTGML